MVETQWHIYTINVPTTTVDRPPFYYFSLQYKESDSLTRNMEPCVISSWPAVGTK